MVPQVQVDEICPKSPKTDTNKPNKRPIFLEPVIFIEITSKDDINYHAIEIFTFLPKILICVGSFWFRTLFIILLI